MEDFNKEWCYDCYVCDNYKCAESLQSQNEKLVKENEELTKRLTEMTSHLKRLTEDMPEVCYVNPLLLVFIEEAEQTLEK